MRLRNLIVSLALLSGCATRWAGCDTPLEPINRAAGRSEPAAIVPARQPSSGTGRATPTGAARDGR
jgi:hypothetical protein